MLNDLDRPPKSGIEAAALQQMKMWLWFTCQSCIEEWLEENIISGNLVTDELEDAY